MSVLNLFTDNKRLRSYSHGPRFNAEGGIAMFFAFFAALVFCVLSFAGKNYVSGILLLVCALVLFILFFDIRGLEYDSSTGKIREYRWFPGVKRGSWYSLDSFNAIYITRDKVVEKTIRIAGASDNHARSLHYYNVVLVNESNMNSLFLAEYENYYKALDLARKIVNIEKLSLVDTIKGSKAWKIR